MSQKKRILLIEEDLVTHPATQLIVDHYLQPLQEKHIDAALLACTHYPLLRPLIQQTLGPSVVLIEPAAATAQKVLQHLARANQLNTKKTAHLQFYATDDPQKFAKMAQRFFGSEVQQVLHANI